MERKSQAMKPFALESTLPDKIFGTSDPRAIIGGFIRINGHLITRIDGISLKLRLTGTELRLFVPIPLWNVKTPDGSYIGDVRCLTCLYDVHKGQNWYIDIVPRDTKFPTSGLSRSGFSEGLCESIQFEWLGND